MNATFIQPSIKPRGRFRRWLWDKCHQQTVCAWCGPRNTILRRAWLKPLETSHGICPECAEKQLHEAKVFNVDEREIERSRGLLNMQRTPEQQAEYERGMRGATVDPYRANQLQNSK